MGAAKKPLEVKEAFRLAQKPHQNHAKLVVALRSAYNQVGGRAAEAEGEEVVEGCPGGALQPCLSSACRRGALRLRTSQDTQGCCREPIWGVNFRAERGKRGPKALGERGSRRGDSG